jgi:UDP-N-acetylmuramyl tripeptide synthase
MQARIVVAVVAARAAAFVSRRVLRRGGTALPGLFAERIAPGILASLGGQLGRTVLVTGTNGKTTTARILVAMFAAAGMQTVANREGSNLTRGMVSALLARTGWRGRITGARSMAGVFEADEASLPAAVAALNPGAIVFTNLFRDQLDRYGEVDTVAGFWRRAIAAAPGDCTLVLNADDPSVAELATASTRSVHWFGIDDRRVAGERGAFDARWCGVCGADFIYRHRFFGHIGHWRCPGCGRGRPTPETRAITVDEGADGLRIEVGGLGLVATPMRGQYNGWNTLAAVAAARALGLPEAALTAGPGATGAVFGRQEAFVAGSRTLRLYLVKNPAGANQVVQLLAGKGDGEEFAFFLNDRFADGQDVSWTWDVDFEEIATIRGRAWAGGDRAADAALRLHYAGLEVEPPLPPEPRAAIDALLTGSGKDATVNIMVTYTAMLDLRGELARRGLAHTRLE